MALPRNWPERGAVPARLDIAHDLADGPGIHPTADVDGMQHAA